MPGPMPRREEALARPRARKGKDQVAVTKGLMREVTMIDPDEAWHPIARQLWDACATSGQSDFYQNSDWALLYSICEDLSIYKANTYKRSGQMLQTIYSALERLLVSEGDRRRVRIELHAPEQQTNLASVTAISEYEKELGL